VRCRRASHWVWSVEAWRGWETLRSDRNWSWIRCWIPDCMHYSDSLYWSLPLIRCGALTYVLFEWSQGLIGRKTPLLIIDRCFFSWTSRSFCFSDPATLNSNLSDRHVVTMSYTSTWLPVIFSSEPPSLHCEEREQWIDSVQKMTINEDRPIRRNIFYPFQRRLFVPRASVMQLHSADNGRKTMSVFVVMTTRF